MIKYTPVSAINHTLFTHPFEQDLDCKNRWVILRDLTPWDALAKVLMKSMSDMGRSSIDLRYVIGVLIIQSMENLTDEGVIAAIQENIYMQYFIGLPGFKTGEVFVPELLVEIRKRLGESGSKEFSRVVLEHRDQLLARQNPEDTSASVQTDAKDQDNLDQENLDQDGTTNKGVLKVDATVAPACIKYPTDIDLLNQSRKITESIIDLYWCHHLFDSQKKPRTYRTSLDKKALSALKSKKLAAKKRRRIIRVLLTSLHRNVNYINTVIEAHSQALTLLDKKQYQQWLVVQHIYDQQLAMYQQQVQSVKDRIVSIHQPWVRPIVRGKSGKQTEFGSQIDMVEQEGYVDFFRIDFDKYNEAEDLIPLLKAYRKEKGYWPASVLVDQIYLNRVNREFLKEKHIANYGVPLGRPPKLSAQEKQQRREKQYKRSEIEGKFGQAKMSFGLNRIRTKNYQSSLSKIGLVAFALNLWKILQDFPWHYTFWAIFYGNWQADDLVFVGSPTKNIASKLAA